MFGRSVVFACGGGIYTSAVEAALKNNGYVIGVDVDQNYIGANGVADGTYAYNPFITSAMQVSACPDSVGCCILPD